MSKRPVRKLRHLGMSNLQSLYLDRKERAARERDKATIARRQAAELIARWQRENAELLKDPSAFHDGSTEPADDLNWLKGDNKE